MILLGIETSCDETAVAVVKAEGSLENPKFEVLGSSLISQANLHAEYGGVYPNLAKREHLKNLPAVFLDAIKEANLISNDQFSILNQFLNSNLSNKEKIWKEFFAKLPRLNLDAITVTIGPGLEPALWVGINFAEELGQKLKVPIIPTNHMLGHVASVLLQTEAEYRSHPPAGRAGNLESNLEFPAVALLVSGGHTELVLLQNWKDKKILGQTRDDAVGEAFDKVARMLGLPYPGGPEISALAEEARSHPPAGRAGNLEASIKLPRPMINSDDYDFSFSGLKTSVLYHIRNITRANIRSEARAERGQVSGGNISNGRELLENEKIQIAREFSDAVIEVLTTKTCRAIKEYNAQSLILGGGVSANRELREAFKKLSTGLDTSLFLPNKKYSTDNAVMIAMAAYIETDCGTSLPRPSSLRSDEGGQASASPSSTLSAQGNLKIS